MPISDAQYMLRTASDGVLDGTEDLAGVNVGPAPHDGMLLRIYCPLGGTTFTAKLQQSSDNGVGDAYADVENQVWTITAAGTHLKRVWWDEGWIQWQVTACTGDFGLVTVGLVQGGYPA